MKTYRIKVSGASPSGKGTACSRVLPTGRAVTGRVKAVPFPFLDLKGRRGIQISILLLAVFTLLGAGDENARFSALGHKLMCVCSCNQVLLECNHVGCRYSDRMREELGAALKRADSDDLVLQSFVQKYGPTVLLAPTTTGFNRLAWIMPYLALALGLTTVTLIIRTWRGRGPGGGAGRGNNGSPGGRPELERFRDQARRETEI
jgi:cytochrome c-type biogenesis protein CcmH